MWETVSVGSCECNYYVCTCIREMRTACETRRVLAERQITHVPLKHTYRFEAITRVDAMYPF